MVTKVSDTVVATMAERQFRYDHSASSGLNFVLTGGTFVEDVGDGGAIEFEDQTLILTDNTVNYIYFEFDNTPATVEVNTSKPVGNIMLIYQVVTAGGAVSSYTDYRWKQINNRFLQDAFWPAAGTEDRLVLHKHRGSVSDDQVIDIRGLDTPFQRVSVISEQKSADNRIAGGDSTSGLGYGFWRQMSVDGNRHLQTRNVNGSTGFPFIVYEQNASGCGPVDWTYGGVAIPQLIDNTSTPSTNQIHAVQVNPVYSDVIVSASGLNFVVYDDNLDGTYSVRRPADSFDVDPLGSSQRSYQNSSFSADGEYWAYAYSGGSTFYFYQRSGGTPSYTQMTADAAPGNEYNGALVYWDEANSEFVFKTRTTNPEKLSGWTLSGGIWSQAWEEDSSTNVDWTPAGNAQALWFSSDGQVMIITSTVSGGSDGMHKFDRRPGGGWDYDPAWTPPVEWTITWGGADFLTIKDNYVYISGLSGAPTDTFDQIWAYENGDFRHVMTLSGGYDDAALAASSFPKGQGACVNNSITVLYDGTLDDPSDSILKPWSPFWYWYHYSTLGDNGLPDYRKEIYGFVTDEFDDKVDYPGLVNWYIYNNDSAGTLPSTVPGPLANTFAWQGSTGDMDVQTPSGVLDQNDVIANSLVTVPQEVREGAIIVVWKSPVSWPSVSDGTTTIRPLVAFGSTGSTVSSQAQINFGVRVQSLGANAVWAVANVHSNGTNSALVLNSTETVPLNQWNVTILQDDQSNGGLQLWNNGVRIDLDVSPTTSYLWPGGVFRWLNGVTSTKRLHLMSHGASTTYELINTPLHAVSMYSRPFAEVEIQRITAEYGL